MYVCVGAACLLRRGPSCITSRVGRLRWGSAEFRGAQDSIDNRQQVRRVFFEAAEAQPVVFRRGRGK